jgi:flagellar basal-body rod protein FlgC
MIKISKVIRDNRFISHLLFSDYIRVRLLPENRCILEEGFVFLPNVSMVDEMSNMISASRSYQGNVEVLNTSKQLMLATLRMGQ